MTIVLQALGILCGLACVVFASGASQRRADFVAMALGFGATPMWIGRHPPDPGWAGLLVVAFAALALMRPSQRTVLAAGAGVFGALWAWFLQAHGIPWLLAWLSAAALLGTATVASRRPGFASPLVREEALLLVCCLGLFVALGPQLAAGWRSAGALNEASLSSGGIEGWVLLVGVLSVVSGGLTVLVRER